jgi:amidophosphoribosyltransferase
MPSRGELVAYGLATEDVAEVIGADLVIFQDLKDLENAVRQFNPSISQFECSVFNGVYLTGGVDEEYLQHIEKLRSDSVRDKLYGNAALAGGTTSTITATHGDPKAAVATIANLPVNTHSDETVGLHNSYNSN